ncbi:MAG: LysM peptidoglycan-binding domain-containing protein [Bacteroidetes bacterium]|nr:LysM peptidoglycan-binding domain-containing protein [Bacteroidota bacterium]
MEIDLQDKPENFIYKSCEFPENHYFFGNDNFQTEYRVFIKQETLKQIEEYLSSDVNNELGGVLVGDICINKDDKKFILINDLITAMHSNSSLSRLTFTHETWDYINEVMEKDFPGKKILGWFHSHPGHTVFLSNYDLFIHENFFNIEYMVAYVFDPTIKERGFFIWDKGKIEKSEGFFVYDYDEEEFNELIRVEPHADLLYSGTPDKKELEKRKYKIELNNKALVFINVLILLILLLMIYNFYEINKLSGIKEEYLKELSYIKEDTKNLNERLNSYIFETEQRSKATEKTVQTKTEPVKNIPKADTVIKSSGNTAETKNEVKENKTEEVKNESTVKKYVVKNGDTLERIALSQYKSRAGIEFIMKVNKLKDKTDIKIGQVLNLPEKME